MLRNNSTTHTLIQQHTMSAGTERYYQESKRGAQIRKDGFKKYVKDHSLMVRVKDSALLLMQGA